LSEDVGIESGYVHGNEKDYGREHAFDLAGQLQFLAATQPATYENLGIDQKGTKRDSLWKEIRSSGINP
jgi:hypothetical protein